MIIQLLAGVFSLAFASDPVGIDGKIEKVVISGGEVRMYGRLSVAGPSDTYSQPTQGFVRFKLPAGGEGLDEIAALKQLAGSAKCVGFGQRNFRGAEKTGPSPTVYLPN